MRKFTVFSLLIFLSFAVYADPIPGFHQGDLKSLFDAAKSKKQIVMIDFFTTWCGPCKLIEENIYRHESFLDYTKKLVAYKIDAEKGEGVALAAKYGVKVYPSVIFMDADGNEIERVIGYNPNRENYLQQLDRIILGKDVPSVWETNFSKSKSLETANKLSAYFQYFNEEKRELYLNEALKFDPKANDPRTRQNLAIQVTNLLRRDFEGGSKACDEYLAKYPVDGAYLQVAAMYSGSLKKKDVNKAWEVVSNAYSKAGDNIKPMIEYYYKDIKKAAGKSNKADDIAALKSLDLKTGYGAVEAAKTYAQYMETEKAKNVLLDWLKANPSASLLDLNNVGWTAFELKLAQKEFADALVKKWEATPEKERDMNTADTIANLCHECGEKLKAIQFGQIAYDMAPDNSGNKKAFKENLEKYKSGQ